MNKTYDFYFGDNNIFKCARKKDETDQIYEDIEARSQLRAIDKFNIRNVKVSERRVYLTCDEGLVIIRDLDSFFNENLQVYLKRSFRIINKAISKYNLKTDIKRYVANNKKFLTSIGVAGSLLIAVLSSSSTSNSQELEVKNINDLAETYEDAQDKIIEPITDEIQGIADNISFDDNLTKQNTYNIINTSYEDLNEELERDTTVVHLNYERSQDTEKATHAYDNYHEIVEYYAPKWGISPNLIMSMLTQESGGYETNLMQIEFDAWLDQRITVYNFYENKYESFMLTKDKTKISNSDITYIYPEDITNPITNISFACIIVRYGADNLNFHVASTIQCFNMGIGNMNKILNKTAEANNCTRSDLLSDQSNTDFVNYTNTVGVGDPEYLIHVLSFMSDQNEEIVFKVIDKEGKIKEVSVIITPQKTL